MISGHLGSWNYASQPKKFLLLVSASVSGNKVLLEWFKEILKQRLLSKVRAGLRESNKPRASNREGPYHSSVCKGKGRGSYCKLAGVLGVAEGGWTGDVTLERETQLLPNHGRAEIINTPDSLFCPPASSGASHCPNPTKTHRQENLLMQSMSAQPPGVDSKVGKNRKKFWKGKWNIHPNS